MISLSDIFSSFRKPHPLPIVTTYNDVTGWQEAQQYQTGGTREKCWLISPEDNSYYFFKVSIKKGVKDYPTEFWMEIIASKVGQSLNLNVLDYNIAKRGESIGCISKHMVDNDKYALTELMHFLMGFEPAYNPEEDKDAYSIEFIYETLKYFGLEQYMPDFIDVVVFDCIIGNQDRHQENWGFITPVETKAKILSHEDTQVKTSWKGSKVAPIYDSGSSLGRERSEEVVLNMLRDPVQFEAYINRYKPEVRMQKGAKVSYDVLLNELLTSERYGKMTRHSIQQLTEAFDTNKITDIVTHIDDALPADCKDKGLSDKRKQFIIKLMNNRVEKLKKLI